MYKINNQVLFIVVAIAICVLFACSPKPTVNAELAEIAKQDQIERTNGSFNIDNDSLRLKRVQELELQGSLQHALDYYHAALVFQHGTEPHHYLKAHLLSKEAVKMDPTMSKARWLNCAAEDRYLLSIGKAQVWGAQHMTTDNKRVIRKPFPMD